MGICCINCFQDDCIIKIIKENEEKGDCEYCGSEDTCCMDTFELTDIFSPLMEIYEETTYGEHYGYGNDPNNCGGLLEDLIQEDWTIFSEGLDSDKAKNLLWDILSLEGDPDNPVDRYELYSRYNGAFTHVEYDENQQQRNHASISENAAFLAITTRLQLRNGQPVAQCGT